MQAGARRCLPVVPAAVLAEVVDTGGLTRDALSHTLSSGTLKGHLNTASQRLQRYIGDLQKGFAIIICAGAEDGGACASGCGHGGSGAFPCCSCAWASMEPALAPLKPCGASMTTC